MAITRRQFIKRSGLVAAGSFLGPGLLSNPLFRQALAQTIGDRYFVVIFLDGGNDGLNTVTPIANGSTDTLRDAYEDARRTGNGGLRLTPGDLAATTIANDPNTGTSLGLHPGFLALKQLYDLGKVSVIQGCGYPDYSLSHEQSRSIWQTANPLGVSSIAGSGWMGRYLAANYGGTDIPAVNISDAVVGEFIQQTTSVLTLRRLANFGFPYDYYYPSDVTAKRDAFNDFCVSGGASVQSTIQYIGNSGLATLLASEEYPQLHSLYVNDSARDVFNQQYEALESGTASRIREVAKIINGVRQGVDPAVHARFFQVNNGGYDTHSDQGSGGSGGQHYGLHKEVGDALKVFYDDCADMGVADKLCVLVWSEFSRRIPQNDNGTDHGSQGPMFLIGGKVNGGVYGNHPNINDSALDGNENTEYRQDANPFRSTDFRDVYGTVLKHWLNMPSGQVATVLPADGGNPSFYWTAPNFDLVHPVNGNPLFLP